MPSLGLELLVAEEGKNAYDNNEAKYNNIHVSPTIKSDMLKVIWGVKFIRPIELPNIVNSRQHLKIKWMIPYCMWVYGNLLWF